MSEWINLSEKKPNKDQFCITSFAPTKGRNFKLKRHYVVGYGLQSFGCRVADMWMPLVEPKEQGDKNEQV